MTLTTTAVRPDADTIMEGWHTGATPPDFAPPLGADDDGSTLLVAFDVTHVQLDSLAVEITENAVVIHGDANPAIKHAGKVTRYFGLPRGLDPTTTQTRYDGKVLMVRLQRPASSLETKAEDLVSADDDDDDIATVEDLFDMPPLRGETPRARSWAYTPRKGRRTRRSLLDKRVRTGSLRTPQLASARLSLRCRASCFHCLSAPGAATTTLLRLPFLLLHRTLGR